MKSSVRTLTIRVPPPDGAGPPARWVPIHFPLAGYSTIQKEGRPIETLPKWAHERFAAAMMLGPTASTTEMRCRVEALRGWVYAATDNAIWIGLEK